MRQTANSLLYTVLSLGKWFVVAISIIGIFPSLFSLYKILRKRWKLRPVIFIPAVSGLVLFTSLLVVCVLLNLLLTIVPPIDGLTVAEAEIELFDHDLQISLPQGQTKQSCSQHIVELQIPTAGTVILRGESVTVRPVDVNYYNSRPATPSTSSSQPTDIPEPSNTPLTTPVPTETSTTELNTDGLICVPNVCAMEEAAAVAMLAECGLDSQVFWTYPDELFSEQYYIIDQSIPAGSYVAPGTLVEIERGITQTETSSFIPETTEMVVVPNVYSLEESAAITILAENKLTSSVYWSEGNDTPQDEYFVIAQSIPSGSIVPVGTEIKLERGIVQPGTSVIVPDVVGMEQTAATKLLVATGLQFQVSWSAETDDQAGQYYIESQSFPKGTTVPAGTLVELMLTTSAP